MVILKNIEKNGNLISCDYYPEAKKMGTIRHWQKEIKAFEKQIENRKNELMKREKNL